MKRDTIKRYTRKTIFDEPLDVTFIHTQAQVDSNDPRVNQLCTCVVRLQNSAATFSATTVKNPNDAHNMNIAEAQAFKKVIDYMYYAKSIPLFGKIHLKYKTVSSFYRRQLYLAKKKTENEINRALNDAFEYDYMTGLV
jgi:hypothetical protein